MTQSVNPVLREMPKVELHVHLEGSIPIPTLWELVKKYRKTNEAPSLDALRNKFVFKNFPHFIETWIWKGQFLNEEDDFEFIAEAVAKDWADQGIVYVESFFSPGEHERKGLSITRITEALRRGLDKQKHRIEVSLVADLIRDFGPEMGEKWFNQISETKDLGVIGIGIGGSEQNHPPQPYEKIYQLARRLGFKTSAHAGEAAGAESIWDAIKSLKVDRIGHGTRAFEDPALLDYLAENKLPIEMCPLSNLRTGVVQTLDQHPIKQYYDHGIVVTVNTDDPKMFNNSLAEEYEALGRLGFSDGQIVELNKNAVDSAWCSDEKKAKLHTLIDLKTKSIQTK